MSKKRKAPIDIPSADFKKFGYELVDQVASLLETIDKYPVSTSKTPGEIRETLNSNASLPEKGGNPGEILNRATRLLFENSLYNGHPKFWGYITSSAAPIGILGEFLAAAVNPNLGGWQLSPMATEIEAQTVRWIAELIDYPSDCGGVLVSGGNMANFVCFLAARVQAGGEAIRSVGLRKMANSPFRVYASNETHTWIQKATDLFGLGTDAIRWIKCDSDQRIDMEELRETVALDVKNGITPMMVVGTAGTVSTGAVDPLYEMAEFCREERIWFHVDGAYGGLAAAVPGLDKDLYGLKLADSIAVDPHKWLYAPLEAGCVLVRDGEHLRRAFSYHPPYYHFGEEAINYVDYGMQNSRGFRALKIWLALQQVGREGYRQMISDDIRLAKAMHEALAKRSEIESLTCELSIATFRYVPLDLKESANDPKAAEYLDQLNEEILVRLKTSGETFISNAVLHDRFVLRACIVNFRTSDEDVEVLPEIIVKYGKKIDSEMRKEAFSRA